jgi:hypothetical protein
MEAAPSFQDSSDLEYLKQLGSGPFGAVWLARVVAGSEVGRLVVARRLSLAQLEAANVVRVVAAARNYSIVSHPSLAKILGCHTTDTELVLLEEHVIGVPLNRLQDLAQARQTSVPINIGVKLVLDMLRAAAALRRSCSNQRLLIPGRTIFPDSVMLASFGEALLSGVGVTQELCRCRSIREHPDMVSVLDPREPIFTNAADERFEAYAAGAILWKLLVIPSLFNNYDNQKTLNHVLQADVLSVEYEERLNLCAPKPIAAVIRRATRQNLRLRYQSLQEMISAIEVIPPALLATDVQVRSWLENVAGDFLSDMQYSSGLRRVPSSLPPARSVDISPPGTSYIRSSGHRAPTGVEVAPAGTSSSEAPISRKRHVRRAYFIGTLLGITLSLILSYLGTRFKLRPTPTASALAPMPIPTKTENSSPSDRSSPAEPTASAQDAVAASPAESNDNAPPQTKSTAPQAVGRDDALVDPKGFHPSNTKALRRGTKTTRRPIPASRNPWGI